MINNNTLLRHRSFLFFLLMRIAMTVAFQMFTVAVGWQIYTITNSAFYLGLVGLAQFAPMFLLTLVSGYAADHFDRKIILRICQIIEGTGMAFLAVGSYEGFLSKEIILLIAFITGAAKAFESPTTQALMPALVPHHLFPKATAWAASAFQTAVILGPAFGGIIYAISPVAVYSASCFLLIGACAAVSFVACEHKIVKRDVAGFKSIFAGVHYIKSKPAILGAISLDLFAVLLGGATALLPAYAKDILFTGPAGLGLLRSAPAIGALGVSLYLGYRPLKKNVGKLMFLAVMVFGIMTITFGLSRSFVLSLLSLAILGGADVVSVVIRASLVQLETPDEMRGRVSAVNFLFIGTSNQLGEFESGLLASWFGLVPSVVIGGIGTIFIVALWIILFPVLYRRDTLG